MDNWKTYLYDRYVSTGQAINSTTRPAPPISLRADPYFERLIERHMTGNLDAAIADVACGHGTLLASLKDAGFQNIRGVDVSSEQVAMAHEIGVTDAVCGDMVAFLRENPDSFDVIFLMDILEHLERSELFSFLFLVRDALKKDGQVIIHVPNGEGLFGMRVRFGDLTHENCFTSRSIRQLLSAVGFYRIESYEDRPVAKGLKGIVRSFLWPVMTFPFRLLLKVEVGKAGGPPILSQNMLATAVKRDD